jgi:hypothetical protein
VAVVLFASAGGAPGVTTVVVGLASEWNRPVLIVEADTASTSQILPGALRGQVPHITGLTELTVADYYGRLDEGAVWDQSVQLGENAHVVPGFTSLRAARSIDPRFWRTLVDALRVVEARGIDVFIDAGRIKVDDERIDMLREAESVTLVVEATLPGVAALHPHVQRSDAGSAQVGWLRESMEQIGHGEWMDLLVVDHPVIGAAYPASQIAQILGLHLVGSLPSDPRGAAQFTFHADPGRRRTRYARALQTVRTAYDETFAQRAPREEVPA